MADGAAHAAAIAQEPIPLSGRALVVEAKAIWTPS